MASAGVLTTSTDHVSIDCMQSLMKHARNAHTNTYCLPSIVQLATTVSSNPEDVLCSARLFCD